MTEIVQSVTAQIIAAAETVLGSRLTWPDTTTGLAYFICDRTGEQPPGFAKQLLRVTTPLALRRTPELSAYGFVGALTDKEFRADWIGALDHLMGREVFPADRQSFIFDPLEVLGIASGIAFFDAPDRQRVWYADTLHQGLANGRLITEISKLSAMAALRLLSPSHASVSDSQEIDLEALSTSELLLAAGIQMALNPQALPSAEKLHEALLSRFFRNSVRLGDAAEAVTASMVARRVADRAMSTEAENPVELIVSQCRRFPLFARQMGRRQRQRAPTTVEDEYDVQDLLHAILLLSFEDVRPEENTPSYAGNSSRLDFFLPRERIIVEAKMTRKGLGQKKVVDELLIDCARYSRMPSVDHLVCVIYDPAGECKNAAAIEPDIERSGSRLNVRVVVCPRGI